MAYTTGRIYVTYINNKQYMYNEKSLDKLLKIAKEALLAGQSVEIIPTLATTKEEEAR